jgi:hypothetical protein
MEWNIVVWAGLVWLMIGNITEFYESGNKPTGYMKSLENS